MESFVKRMVSEHTDLHTRIAKLESFIYSDKSNNINKADFANMCMQLSHMRNYEKCLLARLENQNVVFESNSYYERVAEIKMDTPSPVEEVSEKSTKPVSHD